MTLHNIGDQTLNSGGRICNLTCPPEISPVEM